MKVQCFEPSGQPRKAVLDLEGQNRLILWIVRDKLIDESRGLRLTVMRRPDMSPPPNGSFLLELDVLRKRPSDPPFMRVQRVGRGINLEWIRQEGRSRVTVGAEYKNGSRFEAVLPDMRSVIFAIEVEENVVQGAAAASGGSSPHGPEDQAAGMGIWMIPTVLGVLENPLAQVRASVSDRLQKMGINRALLSPAIISSLFMFGSAGFALWFYVDKNAALAKVEEIKAQLADAEAGRDAALVAESACVSEREKIAKKLDDIEEARKLQAEVAMSVPMAQSMSVEYGGPRMATEDALAYDQIAVKNTHGLVVGEMGKKRPKLQDPSRCLIQDAPLGQDLPKFILFWHPDPDFLCPEEYATSDGVVDRAGPWGLSTRAAAEFGAPQTLSESAQGFGEAIEDSRMNHRWSSHAMATGIREIVTTVLEADTGERPPVAAGQVHMWSLAIWDAYNRMPSPADGVMDKSAIDCVTEMMQQVTRAQDAAEPGQPVLPDVSLFALGDGITLTPSAHCPWPADGLTKGAKQAVEAVTRRAVYELEKESGDEG